MEICTGKLSRKLGNGTNRNKTIEQQTINGKSQGISEGGNWQIFFSTPSDAASDIPDNGNNK